MRLKLIYKKDKVPVYILFIDHFFIYGDTGTFSFSKKLVFLMFS